MEQPHEIKEVSIGRNSFIGYGAVILPGTILGEQCVVGANSVVRGKFPSFAVIAGNPAKIIKRYDQEKDKWIKV
ncbi:O-acetyltransferase [Vibrio ishigakensis]|uniref:O-acetyltransferase n=2 Tax=Vibrio ishigakensis TaxID=1481914 RepID=A0A0B8P4N5_9VIBR|nr:O-acetyltransferase [Vibrio ishigakensis]